MLSSRCFAFACLKLISRPTAITEAIYQLSDHANFCIKNCIIENLYSLFHAESDRQEVSYSNRIDSTSSDLVIEPSMLQKLQVARYRGYLFIVLRDFATPFKDKPE